MVSPSEYRLLFFVDRTGEPRARLVSERGSQVGNVVQIAQTVLSLAEAYEVLAELDEVNAVDEPR